MALARAAAQVTATIPAGQSLSNGVDVTTGQVVRIYMPDDWLDAVITFQVSSDGIIPWRDLYLFDGTEVKIVVVTPAAAVLVPEIVARGLAFVRIRSGTAQRPVVQPSARVFQLIIAP